MKRIFETFSKVFFWILLSIFISPLGCGIIHIFSAEITFKKFGKDPKGKKKRKSAFDFSCCGFIHIQNISETLILFDLRGSFTESRKHLGWKRSLKSSSPMLDLPNLCHQDHGTVFPVSFEFWLGLSRVISAGSVSFTGPVTFPSFPLFYYGMFINPI